MAIPSARTTGAIYGLFALTVASVGLAATADAQVRDFGPVALNATSPATLTLGFSFNGLTAAPVFSLFVGSEFTASAPSCTVGATTNCTIAVSFLSARAGLRQDALFVKNQSGTLLAAVTLHGLGLGPQLALYPGTINTLAGNGTWGYTDVVNALNASFRNPQGVALDPAGNLYIADSVNQVVRQLSAATGAVTTVAGNGISGAAGDGGPAVNANLNTPTGVAVDAAGNLYIADQGNDLIRKVVTATGIITTIAGGGAIASGPDGLGDGGPAASAILSGPQSVALDAAGNLYIADTYHRLVRAVNATTGIISAVAGGGASAGSDGFGDGGQATRAPLGYPAAVAVDANGNLYIADMGTNLVREVNMSSGIITAVAGNGHAGYTGDAGLATQASLDSPQGIALDAAGNLYIADFGNNVIRLVSPSSGKITTMAGSGANGYDGDGNVPAGAALANPASVALDANGNLYIADYANNVIRLVSLTPTPLSYPSEPAGAVSPAQGVSLFSIGNQPLHLGGLTLSASFQQQNAGLADCSNFSDLAPGASCDIAVAFAPAGPGSLTGTLKVITNSLNYTPSVQTINLSGTGLSGSGPQANVSPSTLSFTPQKVGAISSPQTVTLANPGGASLDISNIWMAGSQAGDFQINATTCGEVLNASGSCAVTVVFAPLSNGARSATLSFSDSVVSSPQTVTLNGTGQGSTNSLSPAVLTFSGIIGLTTAAQSVTFSNSGQTPMNILSVWLAGANANEFNLSTTCGASLAVGASCSASVTFSPTALGSASAVLSFADDAGNSPQIVVLNGTGATATPSAGLRFVPTTPCRLADTRNAAAPFGGPILQGGTSRNFVIPNSSCGIPSDAQAFSLNFTVVPKGILGFLSVWPAGQPQPTVSLLNSDGRVKANGSIVPAGTAGALTVYASNDTHVIIDINGYFEPASNPSTLAFYPLTPCRVADTRQSSVLAGGQARDFQILASSCNVSSSAQAYSLNFTVVPHAPLGFLATWPSGQSQPVVSTLNAPTAAVTANAAIVPAGTNGNITVYASSDSDVIIDINGYFAPASSPGALSLFNLTPCRVLDTRFTTSATPVNGSLVVGASKFSTCSVPSSAAAYVLNSTVVPLAPLGFLSLWPDGSAQPLVSTLNASDAAVTSNMAIVPTNNGAIDAYGSNPTHLILDIAAYFAP